jgi:hypothetical protein
LGKIKWKNVGKALINPLSVVKIVKPIDKFNKAFDKVADKGLEIAKKGLVLLNKVNPATVIVRNALRALIALNFIGMASAMNAKPELHAKVEKLWLNLGGDKSKLSQSISNGSNRKPLFGKKETKRFEEDQTPYVPDDSTDAPLVDASTLVNDDRFSDEKISENQIVIEGLGEPITIGASVTAAGALVMKIWNWMKGSGINIVKKGQEIIEKAKDSGIADKIKDVIGKKDTAPQTEQQNETTVETESETEQTTPNFSTQPDDTAKKKRRRNLLIALGIGTLAAAGGIYVYKRRQRTTTPEQSGEIQEIKSVKLN